jgi:hypothetical protein
VRAIACPTVRLVVYGRARGSVRLSGSAVVCGSVSGSVWQCASKCARAAVCGSALGSSVQQCARLSAAVCLVVYGRAAAVGAVLPPPRGLMCS